MCCSENKIAVLNLMLLLALYISAVQSYKVVYIILFTYLTRVEVS